MLRRLSTLGGELMILNALIHTVVGIGLYAGTVAGMVTGGVFDVVHATREREAAWWFFITGLLYLTVGLLLRWAYRQGLRPPAVVGWILIGLAVLGLVMAPSFGWPFIAAVGVLVLVARPRLAVPSAAPVGSPVRNRKDSV